MHALAGELCERFDRIDALLNNAGCYPDALRLTSEGHEEAWATNVLAYEVLTTRLVDRLAASRGRVVLVASTKAGRLDLDDLRAKADSDVACLMLTNPNTLGLFDPAIEEIAAILFGK